MRLDLPGIRCTTARLAAAVLTAGMLSVAPVAAQPPAPIPPEVTRQPLSGVDPAAAAELTAARATPDARAPLGVEEPATGGPTQPAPVVLTGRIETARFDAIGLTWDRGQSSEGTSVAVRVREHGTWTRWYDLDTDLHDGPDAGTPDAANDRPGTGPLTTGGADAYQVRVDAATATAPRGLRVELVDAGRSSALPTPTQSADGMVARPAVVTRAQWGADESLRTGSPAYFSDLRVGVVHHTESTNDYTDGAAQVRSVYAFHTLSRGWSDIGYNFLVDKYGTIYEGRYGGIDANVLGAHAGGYNYNTFGVSAIGSYMTTPPPSALVSSVSRIMAWKMAINHIDPYGRSYLTSAGGGTARYPAGDTRLWGNLLGHRNTGNTDCPGDLLYNQLPTIQASLKSLIGPGLIKPVTTVNRFDVTFTGTVRQPQSYKISLRDSNNVQIREATGSTSSTFAATLPLTTASGGQLPYGRYWARVDSWAGSTYGYPHDVPVDIGPRTMAGTVSGAGGAMAIAYSDWFGQTWVRLRSTGGTWAAAKPLGGQTFHPPAITYRAGNLEVWVRGTNGYLYVNPADAAGNFLGWRRTAAVTATGPGLADLPGADVLVTAGDGAGNPLVWRSSSIGALTALPAPGGAMLAGSSPGAAYTDKDGRPAIAVIGTNQRGYVNTWTGTAWTGWTNLGGVLAGGIGLGSRDGATLYVTGLGTNGYGYQQTARPGVVGTWTRVRPEPVASPPLPAVRSDGTGDLAVVGQGMGRVYDSRWAAGAWQPWLALS